MRCALLVAGVALAASCQSERQRPAALSRDCTTDATTCVEPPPVGVGGTAGSDAGPAPLDSGLPPETRIAGAVVLLDGDDFEASQPFVASATVHAEAAAGGLVAAFYDGTRFALEGVLASTFTWFAVEPEPGLDALTTIVPVDTLSSGDALLRLARPSTLDLIYGLLPDAAVVESDRGHVVLRLVHRDALEPVEGVAVSIAQAGITAYAVGGTWTSDAAGTGPAGLAVVGNLPAVALPGTLHQVVLGGLASGTFDVLVAGDAVTLVDIVL